jgi:drug/metabolite transporter (DMT)-like permease
MKRERMLALVAFAIVCTVWGTTYLAIRIAIETIPPLALTALRFIAAGDPSRSRRTGPELRWGRSVRGGGAAGFAPGGPRLLGRRAPIPVLPLLRLVGDVVLRRRLDDLLDGA